MSLTHYDKEMIRLADSIAEQAHAGQVDKIGRPYITHVRRVAFRLRNLTREHPQLAEKLPMLYIVALLHDTVEDTPVTLPYLARLFAAPMIDAIDALTRREGENYEAYLQRVASNELAVWVKRADIEDNTDPERLSRLDEKSRERLVDKYEFALAYLNEAAPTHESIPQKIRIPA